MARSLAILLTSLTTINAYTLSLDDYNPTAFGPASTSDAPPTATVSFPWPFPSTPGPVSTPTLIGTPLTTLAPTSNGFGSTTVYAVDQCMTFASGDEEQCPDGSQSAVLVNDADQTTAAIFQVSVATATREDASATWYGAAFAFPAAETPVWGSGFCSVAQAATASGNSSETSDAGGMMVAKATSSSSSPSSGTWASGKCQYSVSADYEGTLGTWGNLDVGLDHDKYDDVDTKIVGSLAMVKASNHGNAARGKVPTTAIVGAIAFGAVLVVGIS